MTEKENLMNYLRRQPYEGPKPGVFFTMSSKMGPLRGVDLPVCERGMGSTGYDVFGVHWTAAAEASHYTLGQKPRYTDIETWREELKIPNIEKLDWARFDAQCRALDGLDVVISTTSFMGSFERATCLTSFEDCLVNLISEPEDFADLIGAIADYKIALLKKAYEYTRLDVVNLHDDWGTANSTFMNPDLWREVIKPHTKRIYDFVLDHGSIVCQHSCGSIAPLVGDMVEMGCTIWEAQTDCNDLPRLNEMYGDKLIILGGMPKEDRDAPPAGGEPKKMPDMGELEAVKPYVEYPEFLFD